MVRRGIKSSEQFGKRPPLSAPKFTVELLVDALTTDGAVVSLSGAALSFVAGYNADLLFRVVERVSGALFPKAEGESSKKQEVPTTPRASTGLEGAHSDSGKGG